MCNVAPVPHFVARITELVKTCPSKFLSSLMLNYQVTVGATGNVIFLDMLWSGVVAISIYIYASPVFFVANTCTAFPCSCHWIVNRNVCRGRRFCHKNYIDSSGKIWNIIVSWYTLRSNTSDQWKRVRTGLVEGRTIVCMDECRWCSAVWESRDRRCTLCTV